MDCPSDGRAAQTHGKRRGFAIESNIPKRKKQNPPLSPAGASIGCSNFLSGCFSLFRSRSLARASLDLTPAPSLIGVGKESVYAYCGRARQLDQGGRFLAAQKKLQAEPSSSQRLAAAPPAETNAQATDLMNLSNGNYVRQIQLMGGPWESLLMQFTTPVLACRSATNAAEVLRGMASCKREELSKCLLESLPKVCDLSGRRLDEMKGREVVFTGSEEDMTEDLLLTSLGKMEELALEGLRIQFGSGGGTTTGAADDWRGKSAVMVKDCTVMLLLIQMRDPKERYEAVGEPMIGLIEWSWARDTRFRLEGVHVAGMKTLAQPWPQGRDFLWSTSWLGCMWDGSSNSNCKQTVRNPDRFMA